MSEDKIKILIIEDNPFNMKFASDLLQMAGCEVLEATDAHTGISLARDNRPALILMDLQLPGMDGLTAVKMLKNDAATSQIKVIAMTARAMKGDKERILRAGCDGYIAKPIRYKELLSILKIFLSDGRY